MTGNSKAKRPRIAATPQLKSLDGLPSPYTDLPDDRSKWPPFIGLENKVDGLAGQIQTFKPFDADFRGITAMEIETHVPKYRNLSAALIGTILGVGYNLQIAAKYWPANFEDPKDGGPGVRKDQNFWGKPALNLAGRLYVVVDMPLCEEESVDNLIASNGYAFLESASLQMRCQDATRRNDFIKKYSKKTDSISLETATPKAPETPAKGGLTGARNQMIGSLQKEIEGLKNELKGMKDVQSTENSSMINSTTTRLELEIVGLKNTIEELQGKTQSSNLEEQSLNVLSQSKNQTKAVLETRLAKAEADISAYRRALTKLIQVIAEGIENDEGYDTNTINLLIVNPTFGVKGKDKLYRIGDELDEAIQQLESLDTDTQPKEKLVTDPEVN